MFECECRSKGHTDAKDSRSFTNVWQRFLGWPDPSPGNDEGLAVKMTE
jgi:hypothetical protein